MGLFKSKSDDNKPAKLTCRSNDIGSFKCVLLASYRDLPIDMNWINPTVLEDKVSDSLQFSSVNRFPAIEDGDFTICGESAVLTYLNIRGGAPSVHPRKARVLAMQQYWIQVLNTKLEPLLTDLDANKQGIDTVLKNFDSWLDGKNHIVGEFSLADIHWLAVCCFLEREKTSFLTKYENIKHWMPNLKQEIPNYKSKMQAKAA